MKIVNNKINTDVNMENQNVEMGDDERMEELYEEADSNDEMNQSVE